MTLKDSRDVPMSSRNANAVALLDEATELSASYFLDPMALVDAALTLDPSCAAAHCLRAGLMVMSTDRNTVPLLAHSVAALEALGHQANERERAHAAAAHAWLRGDFASSIRRYGDILLDYPHDLLALQVAHVGDFYLGASSMLRDRLAHVLPYWSADTPGFGYVLGMYAFGLEEMGLYSRAEDTGRRALEMERRDPWAVHAVAHVMEMQGRVREGSEWLTSRQLDWSVDNGFAFHNWWHLGLFQLECGDMAEVLNLYDRRIRPRAASVPLEMVDASAMLWRLLLRNVDVGDRWQSLANDWEGFAEQGYYAFNDAHAVMSFVGAERSDLVERALAALHRSASGDDTNGMMVREVGLPLAQAIVDFGAGRYEKSLERLLPVRGVVHRFGGSHAQRDVIHLTLVEAALRANKSRLARALASERTELKPTSSFNWQLTARACDLDRDTVAAARARRTAEARQQVQVTGWTAVV